MKEETFQCDLEQYRIFRKVYRNLYYIAKYRLSCTLQTFECFWVADCGAQVVEVNLLPYFQK